MSKLAFIAKTDSLHCDSMTTDLCKNLNYSSIAIGLKKPPRIAATPCPSGRRAPKRRGRI